MSAKDLGTNKEASVTIKESSALDDSEIERMRKDAEVNAEEDQKMFELAESRNQAEHLCFQLEKQIADNADKLSDDDKQPMEAAIEKTRETAKTDDPAAIKSAVSDLEQAAQAFSKTLYEKAGADAAAGPAEDGEPAGAAAGSDDDAIDVEFEVKD